MGVWTKKRGSMTGILKIKLVSSPGVRRLWSWATLGSPWQTSGLHTWCYTWQIGSDSHGHTAAHCTQLLTSCTCSTDATAHATAHATARCTQLLTARSCSRNDSLHAPAPLMRRLTSCTCSVDSTAQFMQPLTCCNCSLHETGGLREDDREECGRSELCEDCMDARSGIKRLGPYGAHQALPCGPAS